MVVTLVILHIIRKIFLIPVWFKWPIRIFRLDEILILLCRWQIYDMDIVLVREIINDSVGSKSNIRKFHVRIFLVAFGIAVGIGKGNFANYLILPAVIRLYLYRPSVCSWI